MSPQSDSPDFAAVVACLQSLITADPASALMRTVHPLDFSRYSRKTNYLRVKLLVF